MARKIMRKKLGRGGNHGRILQADIVKRIIEEYGVSYFSALKCLREHGPKPIKRMGERLVWYREDEIEAWLQGDE